jgi:SnoaL-like domain
MMLLKSNRNLLAISVATLLLIAATSSAPAAEVTSKTVVDRLQIQDLITRYYKNFGRENAENFADFYAEGAELILGERHYKGKDGILEAYGRGPAKEGQPPRPPRPARYSFIVTISNPLIVVNGNSASAELVFTEFEIEKQGEAPKVTVQGKEYARFTKVKGIWRYAVRQIKGGTEPPEGWKP